jgi:tetratricopeptide (TPR) repeat protein
MNIGYVYKQQGNKNLAVENLLNAKKELMNALQYNENYHLPYNNLANINRNLLEIMIGIRYFYEDYNNISFDGLNGEEIKKVNNYIKESYSYLNKSIDIEPNFIDNYYNVATFYLYNYLLENKKDKKYIKKAKAMLQKAENINPQARKLMIIKEIIYQFS